jgi:hypothetical protein
VEGKLKKGAIFMPTRLAGILGRVVSGIVVYVPARDSGVVLESLRRRLLGDRFFGFRLTYVTLPPKWRISLD